MKFVPKSVSSNFGRAILHSQKASPNVLFGIGVVGVVTSAVLACRATLKLEEVLDKAQEDFTTVNEVIEHGARVESNYTSRDAQKDKAYVYMRTVHELAKLYGPSLLIGIASIGCLTKSHTTLTKRNAALTAAYAAVDKAFTEYRNRVREEVGEDRERELRYPYEACEIEDEKGKKKTVKSIGPGSRSMYARFFGRDTSREWSPEPDYNLIFLRCQQNYLNDLLQARGHVFLNEAYDRLGVERTSAGQIVGWVKGEGDNYVDFGIFDRAMTPQALEFFTGREQEILLDFNVDGVIYDKI